MRLFLYNLILTPSWENTIKPSFNLLPLTGSKTKTVVTQMPKVHRGDKVVDAALKLKTQGRREGIPEPIAIVPKFVSQPQRRIPHHPPRKGQGNAGTKRNITGCRLQSIT